MANVDSKTCLFRVVGFLVFILLGGTIFMQIEKDKENSTAKQYRFEDLQRHWIKKYNLSRENITTLLQDYETTREREAKQEWSFLNSVYFVLQLLTTIGYGNITPQTPSGQLFTIAYAMVGIPLTLLALKSIGELFNVALRTTIRPLHKRFHTIHCEERSCDFLETGNVFINVMCLSLTWIFVAVASTYLELKRSLITNIYSIFITYSTIGFGDIVPFEDRKYVFMIIVIPGLCSMSGLIDSIVAYAERSSRATRRCFSFWNCWPAKRKARITANRTQQDTASDNEGERVSSDKTQRQSRYGNGI